MKPVDVPKWCQTLQWEPTPASATNSESFSLAQEEAYLRGVYCREAMDSVNRVAQETLKELVLPFLDVLERVRRLSLGSAEESMGSTSSPEQQPAQSTIPIVGQGLYPHPLILPVIHIPGTPMCLQDESQMMRVLMDGLVSSSGSDNNRNAVAWLPPHASIDEGGPSTEGNLLSTRIDQMTRQWRNHHRRRRRRGTSVLEQLQEWVMDGGKDNEDETSDDSHDLTVWVLAHASALQTRGWLDWLARARHDYGIPIIVVLAAPIRSALPGPTRSGNYRDIWIHQADPWPTRDEWWRKLRSRLVPILPVPLVVGDRALEFQLLQRPLDQEHGSFTRTVQTLQKLLTVIYSTPGCFLWMKPPSSFSKSESHRCEWFRRDATARALVTAPAATTRDSWTYADVIHQAAMIHDELRPVAMACLEIIDQVLDPLQRTPRPKSKNDTDTNPPASSTVDLGILSTSLKRDMLVIAAKKLRPDKNDYHIDEEDASAIAKEAEEKARNVRNHRLEQLIILLDHCDTVADARRCLMEPVRAWSKALGAVGVWTRRIRQEVRWAIAEPRRHLVRGLTEAAHVASITEIADDETLPLSWMAGALWQIASNRVSITQEEWLSLLLAQQGLSEASEELLANFTCAVHFLKLQGLLRERKMVGKQQIVYEKTALVWCYEEE